jgi:hypothetical protein
MAYPEYIELFDSGSGSLSANDNGTMTRDVTLKWLVSGKPGYLEAEEWGLNQAPEYYQGHRRKTLNCRPLGNQWWEVDAAYTNSAIQGDSGDNNNGGGDGSAGDPVAHTVAFDTTGATEHITTALNLEGALAFGNMGEEVYDSGSGDDRVYHQGLINVSGGTVHGVDIVVPQFQFTETWVMPAAWILDTYVASLYALTGTMNAKPFRVFGQGECLFLGARCEMQRGATLASVSYQFAARPTRRNFTVGPITVTEKRGWDYMWIRYGSSTDNGYAVQRPLSVHINQVYELGDFSRLAIGTRFPGVYQPRTSFRRAA